MSLRPVVSGFDLDAMLGLLGSGDEGRLARLTDEFDARVAFPDPAQAALARDALRRAVFEGARWPDLEVEGEPHVSAAVVLAHHGQAHLPTGSDVWKMPAFWDFIKAHHDRLPPEPRKYLFMFGRGRPLFGRRIDTPWSYYGFLTLPQTRALLASLTDLRASDPSLQGPQFLGGFLDEFVSWLSSVSSAEKDLWFHCQ